MNLLPREDHGASVLQDCGLSRDWRSELWTSAPPVMAVDPAHGVQSKGVAAAPLSLKGCEALGSGAGVGWETSEKQPMPGSCRASEGPC